MAEGINYTDARQPFLDAETSPGDFPQITLAATSKMLLNNAVHCTTGGANYWWQGKKLYIWMEGIFTTAATPGNLTIEIRLGTTDAGGTILATSAATALTASKTSITWMLDAWVVCRALGSGTAGKLFASGRFMSDNTGLLIADAANPLLLPASAGAETGVDLTAGSAISVQMKRSGSTAETVTVQDYLFQPLN